MKTLILSLGLILPGEQRDFTPLPSWTFRYASDLDERDQTVVLSVARRLGLHRPDLYDTDPNAFRGVYYILVRRARGIPLPRPDDPLGP